MNLSKIYKTKFIPLHLIFWIGVWFFYIYFFSYNSENRNYTTWFSGFLVPITMLTTYFVVYYLIPNYLFTKKYLLFALYGFYTVVFSTYLIIITIFGSYVFLSKMEINDMPPMSRNYIFVLILVYLIVIIVSFFKLLNYNFKTISKNKELQNKILETQLQIKKQELAYLKKQIHPHFLFNTLNTIYGFALKQSKDTPDIILKLSNLLDYILYQINKPKVTLKEEILHINEYIELEKIRFQDRLKISYKTNSIDENIEIAPMLLIPFVENAFKHGSIIDGFLKIEINISFEKNQLLFSIKNTNIKDNTKNDNSGIGLENVKKRLKFLYPNTHELAISTTKNLYIVNLRIFNLNQ